MKRLLFLFILLLFVVSASSLSCADTVTRNELSRLKADVEQLKHSLSVTNQELISTQKAVGEVLVQTKILASQVQDVKNRATEVKAASYCEPCTETIYPRYYVTTPSYIPSYYYPYYYAPYQPPRPPRPPYPPLPPPPPPPS